MARTQIVGLLLAGLLAGYLFGGWVSETTNAGVWIALKDWQTLITGLVAGAAAATAWLAVQRQIKAEDERQRSAATIRANATLEAVRVAVGGIAIILKNNADVNLSSRIETVRALWRDVMIVDPRLGAILGQFVDEVELFNVGKRPSPRRPFINTDLHWDKRDAGLALGLQTSALAQAFKNAAVAVRRGDHPAGPYITEADINRRRSRYHHPTAPMTFARDLLRTPSEDPR